ncbi:transposase-like protein [Salinibacter ruber]|nr:transposase-like protein [Salinibacter ruber]
MLDQTPSGYRDEMHEVLDQVLEASSQQEARKRLDSRRERLEEKTPSALRALEDGFYDTTAVLALPEKYRKRLRTTNMLERFIQEIRRREVNAPDLPKHRVSLPARRRSLCRNPRGMVHWTPVPEHGRILPVAS